LVFAKSVAFLMIVAVAIPPCEALTWTEPQPVDFGAIGVTDASEVHRRLSEVLPRASVIVHFWATWCHPCREELPAVARFASVLSNEELTDRLVVVSVDRSDYDRVLSFLRDLPELNDFHTWQVISGSAGSAFRLFGYPATIVLDADHRVIARHPGPLAWDDPAIRAELIGRLRSRN
jgi:thiol-disulfide isomerase/thioredoxin